MIGSRGVGSNYGGIEHVLDELCPRLGALGHEIDVYSQADVAFQDRDGVRAIRVPAIGGKHFETISRSALSLCRAMRRYELIHFHAVGPGVLTLLTKLFRQRSLVTIHGLDQKREKWGAAARLCLSFAERTLVANGDQITVVSESLRRYFVERYDIAATFIPNGMPHKQRVPPGALLAQYRLDARRYILFASRLTPEKGCHDLIDAFNQLDGDMKLVIAGDAGAPDYIAALRTPADPTKTIFVGHRTGCELAELFSNAYAFVLPSYVEGMSMALLEALAFKLPVLVSDIPENRAVVENYGFYFPAQDVVGLRTALSDLIFEPKPVGGAAHRLESLLLSDWNDVARRFDRLYRAPVRAGAEPFSPRWIDRDEAWGRRSS
jgi:glycosyltransferase involved in cell wall biosynthesis